ncbi:MAG: hypothetical protein A2V81_03165 [Candidatus Abawacabacteria bacterium RBG_16_42_10]|uniref:ABC transporter domain-containing protein n=1 Tax=Candidatus Abawacabacteria bacterium RBG_16_42_10 TaxID=1817814 RepID=A0A1F4XLZ4_9BACT|nr:MAG: hypothetical protein A2V81_03165 [Candidatus Abawacabacteria bacterium RBG_16_42_10]
MNTQQMVLQVEEISKSFFIPEMIVNTLRERFITSLFKRKLTLHEHQILKAVSFSVEKGQFLGIIGSNGSGKSTLLKIISGIYVPDQGNIIMKAKLVPFLELGVGFNPELTGRENIFLNGIILGMTRKEVTHLFEKIVEFSELKEFLDLKLKNYSSGMQLRLAFAIAVHVHADIYIFDEVLAVGDLHFQQKCLQVFEEFRRKGVSIILVSHNLEQIKNFCDQVIWLDNGKVRMMGDPEPVVSEYIKAS